MRDEEEEEEEDEERGGVRGCERGVAGAVTGAGEEEGRRAGNGTGSISGREVRVVRVEGRGGGDFQRSHSNILHRAHTEVTRLTLNLICVEFL